MHARAVLALVALAILPMGSPRAQAADMSVRLVSPGPDTYLSGPVLLKAVVEPPPRAKEAARVLFYADGRLVCTVADAARAECPWDAGAEVKEHMVRVVVDLRNGTRLVATTRTKWLEHAESESVGVVHGTAVGSLREALAQLREARATLGKAKLYAMPSMVSGFQGRDVRRGCSVRTGGSC